MGKEVPEAKRNSVQSKLQSTIISKSNLQQELSKQWSLKHGVVSKLDVSEDGYATVILRTNKVDTSIICKGLANESNTCGVLIKLLRTKSLITMHERIGAFFIRNGLSWDSIDPEKDTFRSGDCLLLVIQQPLAPKVKKVIRHLPSTVTK